MSDLALALIICVALVLAYPIWMPLLWLFIVAAGGTGIAVLFGIAAALFFTLAWLCDLIGSTYQRWKKLRGAAW